MCLTIIPWLGRNALSPRNKPRDIRCGDHCHFSGSPGPGPAPRERQRHTAFVDSTAHFDRLMNDILRPGQRLVIATMEILRLGPGPRQRGNNPLGPCPPQGGGNRAGGCVRRDSSEVSNPVQRRRHPGDASESVQPLAYAPLPPQMAGYAPRRNGSPGTCAPSAGIGPLR